MNNTLVLYHANCMDGFGSAWAYHTTHKFADSYKDKVKYIPVDYTLTVLDIEKDLDLATLKAIDLIMLDYSMSPELVTALCEDFRSVTIIDHHEKAIHNLAAIENKPSNLTLHTDTSHSGCVLTYQFYSRAAVPEGLLLIENRDLWRFPDGNTKAFHAAMMLVPRDFEVWDNYMTNTTVMGTAINEGLMLLRGEKALVKNIIVNSFVSIIHNRYAYFCNCPLTLMSEAGNTILNNGVADIAVLFHVGKDKVKFSIRTNDNANAQEIAADYGGGGHPKAAGFETSLDVAQVLWSQAVEKNEGSGAWDTPLHLGND